MYSLLLKMKENIIERERKLVHLTYLGTIQFRIV